MLNRITHLLLAMLSILAAACGGGATAQQDAAAPTSPRELSSDLAALPLLLAPASGGETATILRDQLANSLVGAGFNIVTDESAAEARAELSVTMVEKQSAMQTVVNGVPQVKYDATASLRVEAGGRIVDQATVNFVSKNGAVPPGVADELATQLSQSNQLAHHAAEWVTSRDAAAQAQIMERKSEDAEQQRKADSDAWIAAKPLGCKSPAALDACEGVQRYLAEFPQGEHANEARTVLDESTPKLEKLQEDDNYWSVRSQHERCASEQTAEACSGVELYIVKFGAGLHAAEAHQLLKQAGLE